MQKQTNKQRKLQLCTRCTKSGAVSIEAENEGIAGGDRQHVVGEVSLSRACFHFDEHIVAHSSGNLEPGRKKWKEINLIAIERNLPFHNF